MPKIAQAPNSETVAYEVNGVVHNLRHRLESTGTLPSYPVAKSCVLLSKFVELKSRNSAAMLVSGPKAELGQQTSFRHGHGAKIMHWGKPICRSDMLNETKGAWMTGP